MHIHHRHKSEHRIYPNAIRVPGPYLTLLTPPLKEAARSASQNPKNKKLLKLFNRFHFGDCFYALQYCRKLCQRNPEIEIEFYADANHRELNGYLEPEMHERIRIKALNEMQDESQCHDCWIGRDNRAFLATEPTPHMWDTLQYHFAHYLSEKMGVECPYDSVMDVLFDSPQLLVENPFSKAFDVMIINGRPMSGQFIYKTREFDQLVLKLKQHGISVITTDAVNVAGISCTRDHNLTITGIGQISQHVRKVIGIHTGPYHICFSKFNVDKVEHWFTLSHGDSMTWNNRITQHNSVNELIQNFHLLTQTIHLVNVE